MFETTFKLTEQELYKGLVAYNRSRRVTKTFRIVGIVLLVAVALMAFPHIVYRAMPDLKFFLLLLFALYLVFFPEIVVRFQAKKLIKKNAQITEQATFTFDETSYQLQGESFSIRTAYNKMYEVREKGEFILFRNSEATSNILPKRALSPEQFATLKSVISSVSGLKSTFKS